jgi:hypothetical protein
MANCFFALSPRQYVFIELVDVDAALIADDAALQPVISGALL